VPNKLLIDNHTVNLFIDCNFLKVLAPSIYITSAANIDWKVPELIKLFKDASLLEDLLADEPSKQTVFNVVLSALQSRKALHGSTDGS